MESSVEGASGLPVEERMDVDGTGLEERIEEDAAATANDGRVNEGDEVFEEAMDTQEEEVKAEVVAGNDSPEEGVDTSTDTQPLVLDGNSDFEPEAENFEEAVGTPALVGNNENGFQLAALDVEKVEVLANVEDDGGVVVANVVDEGGIEEVATANGAYEGNGQEGAGLVPELVSEENKKDVTSGTKEEGDSNTVDDQVENLGAVADKLENDKSEEVEEEEEEDVGEGNEVAGLSNTGEGEVLVPEIPLNDALSDGLDGGKTEAVGNMVTELSSDAGNGDSIDGETQANGDQGDGLNEVKAGTGCQLDENRDMKVYSDGIHMTDVHNEEADLESEINGHLNGESISLQMKHALGSQGLNGKEHLDVPSTFEAEHQGPGGNSREVKDTSTSVVNHAEEILEHQDAPADSSVPVVEGTVTPELGNSTSMEDAVDKKHEKITDRAANEEPMSSQPLVADRDIHGKREVHALAEKLEKNSLKGEKVTEKVQKEKETLPAAELPSSSTIPENPASTIPAAEFPSSSTLPENPASTIPAAEFPSSSTIPENPASTIPASASARPAGLGRGAPLLEPASRAAAQQSRVNGAVSHMQTQQIDEAANGEAEEHDETREKLQMIRVKFLRLAHRLGQTPHNVVVAQVLYRLGLAEQLRGRNGGRVGAFSFDRASAMAEQLEALGQEPLDFSCTIMVLGKTGVGKSATINSIFDETKFSTDAFDTGTKKVQDVVGTVQGIKVRVIDTPGLLPSWTDQRHNEKILQSVKKFIKKTPPDIVLYLDRLDMQSRDQSDMPLLRTITDIFGPSIWFNAIVVLTHAASAPPDGPNGTASSYDMFVTQRSHVVQQAIRQAAGDMRLMNPVSLVENHSACRTNRAGQRVLPNGQVWKPHLLLLSFASKILAEANTLLKLQDSPPGRPFAARSRAPPLPFLLSSLLQPRPQLKLPDEQTGDEDSLDDDLDESSDSEEESEYDELPPFKRLTKAQLAKLSKAQKKAYFDELEYREKLFMKKQLKEERRRRRMMKKMAAAAKDQQADFGENAEEESGGAASVPVPMPDLALPASFDSDNPTHRYRYLDTSNQWLVRPVLETHGWDHDVGYEGINVERLFAVKDKIPISFSGQVTKDKKDANVQMELASSIKHGEGKATSLGFDMQTVGKDLAYTLRTETRFSNYRRNKASAGISVTMLNDALSAGFKIEDKLILNKRFRLLMTGGAITARGDVAYGGSLDMTLRDKDYPLGRSLFTLGLSVMDWHGDLAIGGNVQSQLPIGRSSNLIGRVNLNNRGAGQVSVRVNSSEQLQIALLGLVPLLQKLPEFCQHLLSRE